MKKSIAIITGISLCLVAAPFVSRAQDASASPSPAQSVAPEKPHRDINEFLDKHPRIKEKVLAKFDTNHNGKLDGDEIEAFRKWRREHHEEFKEWREKHQKQGGGTTPGTAPAVQ